MGQSARSLCRGEMAEMAKIYGRNAACPSNCRAAVAILGKVVAGMFQSVLLGRHLAVDGAHASRSTVEICEVCHAARTAGGRLSRVHDQIRS